MHRAGPFRRGAGPILHDQHGVLQRRVCVFKRCEQVHMRTRWALHQAAGRRGNGFECEQFQGLQNAIAPTEQAKNNGTRNVYGGCYVKDN